ncbi:MAG: hypothetical protein ACK5M9_13015, partial [Mycobacterium sp.]
EQIIQLIAIASGCTLAQADEARRALGDPAGQAEVKAWLWPRAQAHGYDDAVIERLWFILASFASFGFCKAHAAAFALPTYQSAWLKRHHPAAFLAGLLTHDPGMYPKRLILEEARRMEVPVLPLDVNASDAVYRVEATGTPGSAVAESDPDDRVPGIRLALADVKGISDGEVERIAGGRPYAGLIDFWQRARPSSDVAEHLVLAGAFDSLYGIGDPRDIGARNRVTRRDLLLTLADLARTDRVAARTQRRSGGRARGLAGTGASGHQAVQLALDFSEAPEPTGEPGEPPRDIRPSGLPEMTAVERMEAELAVLGMDATRHVLAEHRTFLDSIGITWSEQLLTRRSRSRLLVAGVKVATQTPPVRSGRRVIFLTLDDTTGPVDLTFFEDAQGPFALTVFNSWLVIGLGELRRTGPRGVSLRALGAWDLMHLRERWQAVLDTTGDEMAAVAEVRSLIDTAVATQACAHAEVLRQRVGATDSPVTEREDRLLADTEHAAAAGGMGQRRVLVHPSGFVQSPYTDITPAGESPKLVPPRPSDPGRKLWHASPGSAGR